MNQGEYYRAREYNPTSEYKHFPAEAYVRLKEENASGTEQPNTGKEVTAVQPKPQPTPKLGGAKTLIDKLFNSVRTIATATTVAVTSLVVTTTFVTNAPEVDLLGLTYADTYVEYQMEVSGLQEDSEYAIVLSTSNEERVESEVDGDGTYQGRIEGLKPEWEYTLSLVCYDSLLGEVSHFETKFQTEKHRDQQPQPPPAPEPEPHVAITGVGIVGVNRIRVDFTYQDLPDGATVTFDVLCGASKSGVVATQQDIASGYVIAEAKDSDTVRVTPVVTVQKGGEEIETVCESYTHTFTQTLAVQAMVGLHSEMITFYPTGIACGAEYLCITSSADPSSPTIVAFEGVVELWYNTADVITYTLYLSDENGEAFSNEVSLTLDTSVVAPEKQYHIYCVNPGDVGITYNDDGTVNLYIATQFETEHADVYYQVTLGDMCYTSRDAVLRVERVPDQSYTLRYDVCVEIDGVTYSIYHQTPSGAINESYWYMDGSFTDNVVTLQLYKDLHHIDLDSVRLISESGEEIALSQTDFTYNEEYDTYDVTVTLAHSAAHVVVQLYGNPCYAGLEGVEDPLGNTRKLLEYTLEQW